MADVHVAIGKGAHWTCLPLLSPECEAVTSQTTLLREIAIPLSEEHQQLRNWHGCPMSHVASADQRKAVMKTIIYQTTPLAPLRQKIATLGDVVVASFDRAALLSTDPKEVSRLATSAVMAVLRHAHSVSPPYPLPIPDKPMVAALPA